MSKTVFKDEVDQPSIKGYIFTNTPARSSPVKRKHSPTTESPETKKQIKSPDISITMSETSSRRKEETENIDNDVLKALEKLLEPLRKDIKDLTTSHKEIKLDVRNNVVLQEENRVLTERIKKMEQKHDKLLNRVCEIENRLLEANLIIRGIKEGPWETEDVRMEKIYHALTETVLGRNYEDRLETVKLMTIKSTKRLGKYSAMRSRPISVEFHYKSDADYLMNNKKYFGEGIYVDREYCKETEEKRRILRPYLQAARRMTKYHRKCRMEGDSIILRGLSYTTENLEDLPEELQGPNISCRKDRNTIGFFGELNPLSNFYPAPFTMDGIHYKNTEQYIQHNKAKFFKDDATAKRIMESETAIQCQRLSREIEGYNRNDWEDNAKELCYKGIEEKFKQNENARNYLLETEHKTIVESSYDYVWGTGVPLGDTDCLNTRKWRGQGLLGEILEEVRRVLSSSYRAYGPESTTRGQDEDNSLATGGTEDHHEMETVSFL